MPTDEELKQPQRFPLTGDGLVTQRVIASGPLNGPGSDIGEELALARYNDHQFTHGAQRLDAAQQERDAFDEWDREAREVAMAEMESAIPNDQILRRAELRDSGMDEDQIDAAVKREWRNGAAEDQPTERRSQMPDAEADRQADAYWSNLVARARQTEQNAQAYGAAQRQAAPEQAAQLPLDETHKMVLGQ